MTIMRSALTAVLVLALAGCAERAAHGWAVRGPVVRIALGLVALVADPAADGLVLRVEHVGGFVTPTTTAARLPLVSVYADGRVIDRGPGDPDPSGPGACPTCRWRRSTTPPCRTSSTGPWPRASARPPTWACRPSPTRPSTRFTLVTSEGTSVREVYALFETPERQRAHRPSRRRPAAGSATCSPELLDAGGAPDTTVVRAGRRSPPSSRPWTDPQDGLTQPELPWPGPALPGEPAGGPPDVTCVTATGAEAQAVVEAARGANASTPWVTADGARWSVAFRPLLPDETGCADLAT